MPVTRGGLGASALEVAARWLDELWMAAGVAAGAATQVGQPASTQSVSRYGITSRAAFLTISGAGTSSIAIHRGMPAAQLTGGQRTWSLTTTALPVPLTQGGGLPGVSGLTPILRVRALMALSALGGTLAGDMGFTMQVKANALPAMIGVALGQGFGFVGDGAGGWAFQARAATGGALTINLPVVLPAAANEYAVFELRVTPATRNASAILQALVDDDVVITEPWSGGRLPDYAAIASAVQLAARIDYPAGGPFGADLMVAAIRASYGEIAPV